MESQREENEKKRSQLFENIDVEALEKVKTAVVSLEYRFMWNHSEDDELVRQLHNYWDSWKPEHDREYWLRQLEYMRYKWLLSRSREVSEKLNARWSWCGRTL